MSGQKDRCYKYSGEITLNGVLLGLAAGTGTAAVLGAAYGYITVYVPFIYLNLLAALGFAFACGFVSAAGARKGRLQSPAMFLVIGLLVGLAAEYFNWVFWLFAVSRQEFLSFDPLAIFTMGQVIMKEGTWGLGRGGESFNGLPLLGVWIVEAGLIVGMTAKVTFSQLKRFLCCPKCQTWFDKSTKTLSFLMPEKVQDVVEQLNRLNFKVVSELKPVGTESVSQFLNLDLYFCPSCSGFGCFTLSTIKMVQKKDKVEAQATALIERQLIPIESLPDLLK